MHEAVPIVFIVIGLPVICITLIVLLRIKRTDELKRKSTLKEDELEIIEEVYQGLRGLSRRIDNLETLMYSDRDNDRRKT